ncbi:uncharacterized protein LOC121996632 [Zingiber officinale]|uniref:U5 small nuclear ribonucleoprotein TSSC4 n=1 Tax=Zingiber officinale TaxID=94328 RepID=A0A8J5GCT1_ZINOF|nr:uncharacterized protein LOC121996632 [Zingiber officinale]KAG6499948.1 hypothetical protein ZIOFF_039762 [Zingiber officinale]
MENDSFDARVKRLFGSRLFDTVPENSFPASSWNVAAGDVERQRWIREKAPGTDREDDPCASAFDEGGCFAQKSKRSKRDRKRKSKDDLDGFDEEEEELDTEGSGEEDDEANDEDQEAQHVRASVGLDPTLDREEEEDEYDMAAMNRKVTMERIYMKDVNDYGPFLNFHAAIPDSLDDLSEEVHDFSRDPRADHFAASVRLSEDVKAVGNNQIAEDGIKLKSILKRKANHIDSNPKKRVHFSPGCNDSNFKANEEQVSLVAPQATEAMVDGENNLQIPEDHPKIPDYLRNPTKYTCYSLESSIDVDDGTNKKAFEDLRNLMKHSNPAETVALESSAALPMSITFTPQKKSQGNMLIDSSCQTHSLGISIDTSENDTCGMDEDDTRVGEASTRGRKAPRNYRSKSSDDS